ncbi:uncharacterized protein LOC133174619 [Saccostrea echinata]|uniref:uncharacterized protein LOC133174619 n=1 Tax=Saccostrea echinata TaxID=191078 RepID=UPI002A83A5D6|nr:uncharacterized protein LOC133174619 [Saccostrea echinata]
MKFIRTKQICFKCCSDQRHLAQTCKSNTQCGICNAHSHPTALPPDPDSVQDEREVNLSKVTSSCTQVCGTACTTNRSCAKILQVRVYSEDRPGVVRTVYAIIRHCNLSKNPDPGKCTLFDFFHEKGPENNYILVSCAGRKPTFGRQGIGYVVQSLVQTCSLKLPIFLECDDIPNNRKEIPSPKVARQFAHLRDISKLIPQVGDKVEIEMLTGRGLLELSHVKEQRVGNACLPFAQRLLLGWVILGRVCLGNTDKTENDEKPGPSVEDQKFIDIISFKRGEDGRWKAPLPFKEDRTSLPNNKPQALKRALMLDNSLRRNRTKLLHAQDFMQKIIVHGHAEIASKIAVDSECWYLPLFGVYHPRKPESIRMVFDSSAKHEGLSLNELLIKGPDLTNNLLGVLLRFRRDEIAITGDIEQMFYNFKVTEKDRDFLRFLWHPQGDLNTSLFLLSTDLKNIITITSADACLRIDIFKQDS